MDKMEFLDQLQVSLNGKLKEEQVADNLQYYNDYVEEQMRRGRTEKEIMEALGSPRLIARTILDANKAYDEMVSTADEVEPDNKRSEKKQAFRARTNVPWLARLLMAPRWVRTTCAIVVFVGIFSLVVLLLKFLFPFLVIFMIALFLKKLFWDWLR